MAPTVSTCTIANGKVYVATFSHRLAVYGLLSHTQLIGDVVNSASNLGGIVAPGEMVVIYGSELGPPQLAGLQLTSSGRLSTHVAGTQVLFNNVPAPLVYVRSDQVAAIVPNAVRGQPSATVQVRYQSQTSSTFSLPVSQTAPGLFTLDQTGRGQGAILNQDNTINGRLNAAPRGSVVVLYGTGQGASDPDWAEDELAAEPLPKPVNPVKVTIGGQAGEILYAGAAPGMAGVMQVNVRIPAGTKAGSAVPIVLSVGTASSQPGVTLAVQ
jgi:trimeric autotransporter adhesin